MGTHLGCYGGTDVVGADSPRRPRAAPSAPVRRGDARFTPPLVTSDRCVPPSAAVTSLAAWSAL
jgi:hypothetical protein